ncbi:N-acetylglucosamine kinase [Microbacterium mangrovi]|uniref:N-acetylglucosamine kinase n=1 Tax=Microbacterium mangrovi TaxID=1348253 RepID=UPI00068EEF83|nr:BadF/BadG/BcrA/BcrD ATPase family protein [Microbacterium mangrovi]
MTGTTLAMDAGQTGTKVRVGTPGETPVEQVLDGVRTNDELFPQLARLAEEAARLAHGPITVVAAGVSGLTDDTRDAPALQRLLTGIGDAGTPPRTLLAHDSVTSFLGALGDAHGAVIAAGTGVVTLGVGAARVARVDGWGNIMGDAGSGYWIGREALDAAMRDHDGRGPATALTALVRERWPDLERAYIDLQQDPDHVRIVASFAEPAAAVAVHDPVAAAICLRAAAELSHSVATALARVADPGEDLEVASLGGIFRSPLVRRRFEALVHEAVAHVRFVAARGTGLDGAAALPGLSASHPLRTLVSDTAQTPNGQNDPVRVES